MLSLYLFDKRYGEDVTVINLYAQRLLLYIFQVTRVEKLTVIVQVLDKSFSMPDRLKNRWGRRQGNGEKKDRHMKM